jgi:hypothetical protein
MIMRALGLLSAAVVLGCGSGGGGGGGDEPSRLRIEMRPLDAGVWTGVFEADAAQVLRATQVVDLAWGGAYPRTLEITIEQGYATCGSLVGTVTLDEVESQHEALAVELTGPASFRLAPTAEGDFEAIVRGTFVADPGATSCVGEQAPIELHVSVPVRRPVGVQIQPPSVCDEVADFRVESEAHLAPGLYVQLVDDEGTAFSPRNAAATHPATLELVAEADTELSLHTPDDGLAALVVSGATGPVSVLAFEEEQRVIDHVDAAAIDVVGAEFFLLGHGGGGTQLDSGETYGETGWARTSASIAITASGMEVDGDPICTMPRADAFVLESSTRETCIAYDALGHGDGAYGDLVVQRSADVMASGTCVLQLEGPEYSGGAGFSTTLSVEILNAEGLYRTEAR